jgi:hypothetical protein
MIAGNNRFIIVARLALLSEAYHQSNAGVWPLRKT